MPPLDRFRDRAAAYADRQAGQAPSARQVLAEDGGEGVTSFPSPLVGEGGARSAPDEGSLSAETDPSPVSIALRAIDPPSPTRGEGEERARTNDLPPPTAPPPHHPLALRR